MLKNNARKFITKYEKFTYESVKRIDLDIFCMIYVIVWIEDNNWGPTLFEKIIWSIITNFYLSIFANLIKVFDIKMLIFQSFIKKAYAEDSNAHEFEVKIFAIKNKEILWAHAPSCGEFLMSNSR